MFKNPIKEAKASAENKGVPTDQDIIICGKKFHVGSAIVLWNDKGGLTCPNKRGRQKCSSHDPILNDKPTRADSKYKFREPEKAYAELKKSVHQFILHYDVCYSSHHCHDVIKESKFKGSHFYLDLDGTIYQTCDLYWKTNTAPGDDGLGNERAVHIEMANLSWQALADESSLYHVSHDVYKKTRKGWQLNLPSKYKSKIKTPNFKPIAARAYGDRGYFSRRINGRMVRMWDFTEEQYQALIKLCVTINEGLPRVKLKTPFDRKSHRTPLGKVKNFATFEGILGHAHTQSGNVEGIKRKYDPGSAFDWGRLRKRFR
ncbi:MAG: peptidoglycan recognition protein family protein [Nitrospinales bacterium]